jgi:hypothetical protein
MTKKKLERCIRALERLETRFKENKSDKTKKELDIIKTKISGKNKGT